MQAVKISKYEIYDILKDYFWMIREIQRIDRELSETDFNGAAQYGIDATMPRPQGVVGKALENEAMRRVQKSQRLQKYIRDVNFINQNRHKIKGNREEVVLDCLLDGLSLTAIAKHLGMGRTRVTEIRNNIVDELAKD